MTQAHKFTIYVEDNTYWQQMVDEDGFPYEQPARFNSYNELANGAMWGMLVKGKGQRKMHPYGPVARSVYALLDHVQAKLKEGAEVVLLTPDVELTFIV